MDLKNTEVFNFEGALRGMRNPLNSWNKSDSFQCNGLNCRFTDCPEYKTNEDCLRFKEYIIGPNDLDLAQRLISSGPEHAKFLRQIFVSVDITAPLYW